MSHLVGFGGYVPPHIMTNDDWADRLDTSDEWITQRTGIKRRHFAGEDETTVTMAAEAARVAMTDAGIGPEDIDEIVIATDTPEMRVPDTAALLQHELGCRSVPAYDLAASGCAGFIQALDVARSRISISPRIVLVVGVEVITRLISPDDRATAVLFGDGAGAVVMGPAPGRAKILEVVSGTDGSNAGILALQVGGTRTPFDQASLASGEYNHLVMDGRRVFIEAVRRMSEAATQVLDQTGRSLSDVSLVIPHQANLRIIEAVRRKLGLEPGQVFVNIEEYGNIGSATVPLALWEAVTQGRIERGDLVVLTAFGAGFHWAAAAVQF